MIVIYELYRSLVFKSVSTIGPGKTRQRVLHGGSPILLKLGTVVGPSKLFTMLEY